MGQCANKAEHAGYLPDVCKWPAANCLPRRVRELAFYPVRLPPPGVSHRRDYPCPTSAERSRQDTDLAHGNSGYTCAISSFKAFALEKFMGRSTASRAAIALVLAGCSGMPPVDMDPTPIGRAAVTETHVVNDGVADFPAFESVTLTYTRANMRRSESTLRSGGIVTRYLGGANADVRIERLDRKLAWTLDTKNKRYSECPMKGCASPSQKKQLEKKAAGDNARDSDCHLRIGNSTFTAEPTGQKRSINGFDAEQYDISWQVTFRDNASRKSTSTVGIDLWTTPLTPGIKEVLALEKSYIRARDKLLGTDSEADRIAVLPPEIGKMISNYLAPNVSPADRAAFLAGGKKLDKVRGQPIFVRAKWSFSGEACSMDESMKDTANKTLFTFTSEVKSYKLEALHDSLFAPPKGYRIMK
jgi:hypothetical protein